MIIVVLLMTALVLLAVLVAVPAGVLVMTETTAVAGSAVVEVEDKPAPLLHGK